MNKLFAIFTTILVLMTSTAFAQNELIPYKAGHVFDIGLPEYMSKSVGLNSVSAIEYKNTVKDIYGIVIFDTKEDLKIVEMNFSSIDEFYENFIVDFLKDESKRKISKPISQKIGEINFIESDASYYDKEVKMEIYYLVGIVETKTTFYKVLTWTNAKNKEKFKADFQRILYSIKD